MENVKLIALFCSLFFAIGLKAQVSGNVNYQNPGKLPESNLEITFPTNGTLSITVKGMANVKADAYVAIFNVTQFGKSAEEVNSLMDARIQQAMTDLKSRDGIDVYVDMVSFVPMYEYDADKKIFSKKTYNEIPSGFELKKNLHIHYKNPEYLAGIIATLSNEEIYDLVRVDYFSENMEKIKSELKTKANTQLLGKIINMETLIGTSLDSCQKWVADAYKVVYPVEMYRSYQAYSSTSLNVKKAAINQADKTTSLYYQPILDKEFDFVINPVIVEPMIQVLYEIRLDFKQPSPPSKTAKKEYLLLAPNGELKHLDIDK